MPLTQTLGAFALVLLLPAIDLPPMVRLRRNTSRTARLRVYLFEIILLWAFALGAAVLLRGRSLVHVSRPAHVPNWLVIVSTLLLASYFASALAMGVLCLLRAGSRAGYAAALASLRFLLPVSTAERTRWIFLAFSAGICEELLYRGFLLAYLRGELQGGPHLGSAAALLLASAAFGTAHLYQGPKGVLSSSIAGLAFGATALLTGSLLLPMLLHTCMDMQVLLAYQPAPSSEA